MNISQLKEVVNSGALAKDFTMLYGDADSQKERYIHTIDGFLFNFGDADNLRIFSAPGRTEVGGNHTDHQHGCVLTGAVDLDVIAVVSQNDSGLIRIKSEGYRMDVIDLNELEITESEKGHASAIIRGVVNYFKEAGYKIGSFDAYTTSNVFKGSGLSSSAAFETLVGNILNGMFCNNAVSAVDIAKIGQKAERNYFGKPCGLLDQMASSMGGFTFIDFCDPTVPVFENVELDIEKYGYTLCVANTGGSHADLTDDYAAVPAECKAVSEALGVEYLRDANQQKFFSNISEIRKLCGDRAVLRAIHFFGENDRAVLQKNALQEGNFDEFLNLVNESGNSSYCYLQNVYSPSNPKEQGVSLGLALTKRFLGGNGACRVHGGGFAGTIQCYVPTERFPEYKQYMESVFGPDTCVALRIRPVGGYEIKL